MEIGAKTINDILESGSLNKEIKNIFKKQPETLAACLAYYFSFENQCL